MQGAKVARFYMRPPRRPAVHPVLRHGTFHEDPPRPSLRLPTEIAPCLPVPRPVLGRRALRALVAVLCTGGALAFAQSQPPPLSAPVVAWRPPVLQVQGAEQPIRLASLQLDVEVTGGAAETRVQMVFFNPNHRVLEGKLQFPLAPGQVVERLRARRRRPPARRGAGREGARAAGLRGHRAASRRPGPAADDDRQQLRAAHLPADAGPDAHGRAAHRRARVGPAADSDRLRRARRQPRPPRSAFPARRALPS